MTLAGMMDQSDLLACGKVAELLGIYSIKSPPEHMFRRAFRIFLSVEMLFAATEQLQQEHEHVDEVEIQGQSAHDC